MADIILVKGATTVNLHSVRIKQSMKKKLYKTQKGQTSDIGDPITYIRDRRKIVRELTCEGWIHDTAVQDAFTTMNDLITIYNSKGNLTSFTWNYTGGTVINASTNFAIERMELDIPPESSGSSTTTPNVARIKYTLGLIWGTEK